jgi:hypothetical protein
MESAGKRSFTGAIIAESRELPAEAQLSVSGASTQEMPVLRSQRPMRIRVRVAASAAQFMAAERHGLEGHRFPGATVGTVSEPTALTAIAQLPSPV